MTDIASLGLRVDSSEVKDANDDLLQFTKRADAAGDAAKGLGDKSDEGGKKFEGFSHKARNALLSLAGVDERVRASTHLFEGIGFTGTAFLGITAGAAAIAVVVKAFIEGQREAEKFSAAIALTGNAAGITSGQLASMAANMAKARGTQGEATEALAVFVQTARVGADNLERFAGIAEHFQTSVGQPIADTAKNFAALAEAPTKSAQELQESFNFLTPEIYRFIAAHEKAGDVLGAGVVAQTAYAAALDKNAREFDIAESKYVTGWQRIKEEAGKAWDVMVGGGRGNTPEDRLDELTKKIDLARKELRPAAFNFLESGDLKELAGLRELVKARADAAAAAAKQNAEAQKAIQLDRDEEKADIEKKAILQAEAAASASETQRNLSKIVSKYDAAFAELDARRAANLVTDQQYFDKKRALLKEETDYEISVLLAANKKLADQDGQSAAERVGTYAKIQENLQRISDLRVKTGSQTHILDIQQDADNKKLAISYADAEAAAARYVDTLIKRFQVEELGLGLGDKERQRLQDRANIEAEFENRRQQLDDAQRRGQLKDGEYEIYLKIEQDALAKSEAAYDEHYKALEAKQGSWLVGVSEGMHNFIDDAQNVAKAVDQAFTNAFDNLADSIVQFAMTGKFSFKQFASSVIADLLRIETKIQISKALQALLGNSSLGGILGGILGGTSTGGGGHASPGGARAGGGPVSAGGSYLVGENGPEIMTPGASGWVTPNSVMSGMGGVNIINHNTYNIGSGVNGAQMQAIVESAQEQTKSDIYANLKRGRWPKAK